MGTARDRSRSPHDVASGEVALGDTTTIKALVQAREQARCAKDFAQADVIREQLKSLGVEVWDKDKLWKQPSTGLAGPILGFFGDRQPSDVEINTLVVQREKARQSKDFTLSDTIRDELKERGVQLYDKTREWKASDGRRGQIPSFDMIENPQAQIGRAAVTSPVPAVGAVGGAIQGANVTTALLQLAVANPSIAPQILSILPQVAGGSTTTPPPVQGTPKPRVAAPAPTLGTFSMASPQTQKAVAFAKQCAGRSPNDGEVTYLVQARENCRQGKDYSGADLLRVEMKAIGIEVYDKEKVWKTADGRQGTVPSWS
mmetsp:Transcript_115635/g.326908  ORF Transcript_115635/g.326908 Transcript_115635/m.326908 type:complete len:315 (-) Transcript_115635:133-1077(-)